jgi:hypothetical protein
MTGVIAAERRHAFRGRLPHGHASECICEYQLVEIEADDPIWMHARALSLRMRYGAGHLVSAIGKNQPPWRETSDLRWPCCQRIGFVPYVCKHYPFFLRRQSI